jgi:hypothetical protein
MSVARWPLIAGASGWLGAAGLALLKREAR